MASYHLTSAVHRLRVHDHACLIYETAEEQFAAAAPFIERGLGLQEYCGYVAAEHSSEDVLNALVRAGVPAHQAVANRRLAVYSVEQTYCPDGTFGPDKVLSFVRSAVDEAVDKGFTGIRLTGEMTWHVRSGVSTHDLLAYESKLNQLFRELPLTGICQYNVRQFSDDVLLGILQTHPLVVFKDVVAVNHYFVPPEEFLAEANTQGATVRRYLTNILEREQSLLALRRAVLDAEVSKHRLSEKLRELEDFQEAVVGRELKMIQLEKEIERLTREHHDSDTVIRADEREHERPS